MTPSVCEALSCRSFLKLQPYSFGVGDRFSHQAKAQLRALMLAAQAGAEVIPVWNKSYREHSIIGSEPMSVRAAAEAATRELGWRKPFYVDADHITLKTVDGFLASSDYYTLDVTDAIGIPSSTNQIDSFLVRHPELLQQIDLPGGARPIAMSSAAAAQIAAKYLFPVKEAGRIYKRIANAKGAANFITEVSMDETETSQKADELLFILAALADEQVPLQAIAPKFTGRFNKGVDYVGSVGQFD